MNQHCLPFSLIFSFRGGTGWWKYEFCYGKHVLQYHEWPVGKIYYHCFILIKSLILEVGKPRRERDEIYVGKWNSEDHIEYAKTKKVVTRQTSKPTKKVGQDINDMHFIIPID